MIGSNKDREWIEADKKKYCIECGKEAELNKSGICEKCHENGPNSEVERCCNCHITYPFGTMTVMNDVDKIYQIPSVVATLGHRNGMILECPNCHCYFDAQYNYILTEEQKEECNKIWDEKEGGK